MFQPIFETSTWKKIGYEVLLRTRLISNLEDVFQGARQEKQLFKLDSRSIQKAVRTYFSVGKKVNGYLFINVFPSTILNHNFWQFLQSIITEKDNICQQQRSSVTIVFEVIETGSIPASDINNFKDRINSIQEVGFLIAIDDVGSGSDSLQLLIELKPNFIKLDRYFGNNLFESESKMDFIKLLNRYCDQYDCTVVIEGIENPKDLAAAKSLGIRFAQGFLLGRPGLPTTYF